MKQIVHFIVFIPHWSPGDQRHAQKIPCSWNVDHDWRCVLKNISNKKEKCQIYHTRLDKENGNNFELLFNKFMTCNNNNESAQHFAKYFKQEYSQCKHQWATCYLKTAGINTNM